MPTYTKRVVINRSKVERVRLVLADGFFEIAQHILDVADPPDDPRPKVPYIGPTGKLRYKHAEGGGGEGLGLVEGGGAIVYVDGKKVAGTTIGGKQIKKPRAVKLPRPGVMAVVGYGFPGRWVHNGSIHNRAKPFLAHAAFDLILPIAGELMGHYCRPRLARLR